MYLCVQLLEVSPEQAAETLVKMKLHVDFNSFFISIGKNISQDASVNSYCCCVTVQSQSTIISIGLLILMHALHGYVSNWYKIF